MANGSSKKLKAYVRYDGLGRIVPSSSILARFKPKVGNWKEISSSLCCNPIPSSSVLLLDGEIGLLLQENGSEIIL
jgi:hypothetical protein